jgi:hypothetical protein
MRKKRKKVNCQKVYRSTLFDFDQYWNINYTECYKDGSEKDFKTIIKANSYKNAKKFLAKRLAEDSVKIKAVQGFMLHGNYKGNNNRKLTTKSWELIKDASFPNENNFLFKKEIKREKWKSNRFNATNYKHLKTIGFKGGSESYSTIHRKGKHLPLSERVGKKWTGAKWVKWDEDEMRETKTRISSALMACDNNRFHTAKYLNIGRGNLYKMMKRIEGLEWWNKHYPIKRHPPPRVSKEERSKTQSRVMKELMSKGHVPFSSLSSSQQKKRYENMCATKRQKKEIRLAFWKPKIINALKLCENSRVNAAFYLGIKTSHLKKLMVETKPDVNWAKEFPTKYFKVK